MKYIGVGAPAYEKKYQINRRWRQHSLLLKPVTNVSRASRQISTDFELSTLIQSGLDGIEVVHPSHNEARQEFLSRCRFYQYFFY